MATTPSYGWVTPSPTDFVTDLPADFETFADAVDADLAGLLGGTTGQVLTKDSNTDHDFSWATPGGTPAKSYSLLNTGGTALTGATSITVSGISGIDDLLIMWLNASSATASSVMLLRINGDTGTNYDRGGIQNIGDNTYNAQILRGSGSAGVTGISIGKLSDVNTSQISGYARIFGANSSGTKVFLSGSGSDTDGGIGQMQFILGGVWKNSATVSSITISSSLGNFDNGTIYVYGAA